jgi:prepilin-type N-terminal cleavage/methylation domain-containing protein
MTAQSTQLTNKKGFTLIELLVTIAIIAIISVVAVALFGNIQANARDGKRKAELEAIANAIEVNKSDTGYQRVLNTHFGGNKMPGQANTATSTDYRHAVDPQNFPYCIASGTSGSNPADAVTSGWAAATSLQLGTGITCPSGYSPVQSNATPVLDASRYKLCTLLEAGTVFCRTNIQ